jgi:hypothetical protein
LQVTGIVTEKVNPNYRAKNPVGTIPIRHDNASNVEIPEECVSPELNQKLPTDIKASHGIYVYPPEGKQPNQAR